MCASGRAAFSEGRKLANRIAASEAGQRVVSGIKAFSADNRGCVDLETLGGVKSKGKDGARTLYHYTTEEGMEGIISSQKLNPSLKANNPKDARYGNGQYLSNIKPNEYSPAGLAQKLIKVPNKYKYTHYVEIDITDLEVVKGREGIFVIPNDSPLDLIGRIVSTGKVGRN